MHWKKLQMKGKGVEGKGSSWQITLKLKEDITLSKKKMRGTPEQMEEQTMRRSANIRSSYD